THRTRRTTSRLRLSGSMPAELLHGFANRPSHGLGARHFRAPSEGFHATRVEADLRNVARPAAGSAGVVGAHALRTEPDVLGCPLRDFIDRRRAGYREAVSVDL